jgi:thiamine biosynthesis protein ThiS
MEQPIIKLNGQARPIVAGFSVGALIEELGFAGQPVLVECDGVALFPRDFATTRLLGGEAVEVIRIVAGG